jgi:hypothetical protein
MPRRAVLRLAVPAGVAASRPAPAFGAAAAG